MSLGLLHRINDLPLRCDLFLQKILQISCWLAGPDRGESVYPHYLSLEASFGIDQLFNSLALLFHHPDEALLLKL